MTKEKDMIKEKLDFFLSENIEVHIKLIDKTFLNGFLQEEVKDGVYTFKERKLGNVFVFLREIYDIDKFGERK